MANVLAALRQWSETAASNKPADTDVIGSGLGDNLRTLQAVLKAYLAGQSSTVVPSAGVADLTTATGHWVPVSGNSTVTGFGTEVAGIEYIVNFTGAPPLIHNGTSFQLPGAATIQAAAGDVCVAESLGSGNWRIWGYTRNSGRPVAFGDSWVLIQRQVASTSPSIDFTSGIDGTYDEYEIRVSDLTPATDNMNLLFRVSENSGVAWASANYAWAGGKDVDGGTTFAGAGNTSDSSIQLASSLSNSKAAKVVLSFSAPSGSSRHKIFEAKTVWEPSGSTIAMQTIGGTYTADTNAINGVRFLMSSGNITQGNFALYGLRKS